VAIELIVAPEAEQDLTEAYAWYQQQRPGLGEEFLTCVDAAIASIVRSPEARGLIHLNYRRALVRRFPYAVFYEYLGEAVTIYGIFHGARDPQKWRTRLP